MPLLQRSDGNYWRDAPPMRRLIPFLMQGRNESVVYFEQQLDITKTLAYIERVNGEAGARRINIFHIILCSMARTFGLRPQLNRFVVGRRIYQRKKIEMSFAVKKQLTDDAEMTTTKLTFEPDETPLSVAEKTMSAVKTGKSDAKSQADHETEWITKLPRFLIRMLMTLQRVLDYFNLLPRIMIEPDPMYSSIFLANLGSVGLDSAYHHLYEYGTCPFFAAIGTVKKAVVVGDDGAPAVRDVISIKYTFDERITDGLYCSRSLDFFKRFVEDPDTLEPLTRGPVPISLVAPGSAHS